MHRLVALAAVASTLVAGAAQASAATRTIRTNGDGWITRIGELRTRSTPPTFERVSAAFGRPTSVEPVGDGGEACRITWSALRFRATFANFGVGRACAPTEGLLQTATIRSRKFRTTGNLRVGDRSSRIEDKHPGAVFRDNVWWITSADSPAAGTEIPTIEAIVKQGRVEVLRLWVGGAGD